MLRWETVGHVSVDLSTERYRAVSGELEYRIFHDPEQRNGHGLWWILGVRKVVPEGGVPTHIHYGAYRTDDDAKRAAERWEGPPLN